MTENDIYKALGFMPPGLWASVAIAENIKQGRGLLDLWDAKAQAEVMTRRTGRSTRIMVAALLEASRGREISLSAYDPRLERKMVDQVKMWADKLGFDPKLITRFNPNTNHCCFIDHYRGPAGEGRWGA